MFSTSPSSGTFTRATIWAALRTTMPARACGEVTSTTPLIGSDWSTVSEASDVPGGRSTIR